MQDSTDSLISALNAADIDNYPNKPKILEIAYISLIKLTEAEWATPDTARLKTAYRSTMTGEKERNSLWLNTEFQNVLWYLKWMKIES